MDFLEDIWDFIKDLFDSGGDPDHIEKIANTASTANAADLLDAVDAQNLASSNGANVQDILNNGISLTDESTGNVTDRVDLTDAVDVQELTSADGNDVQNIVNNGISLTDEDLDSDTDVSSSDKHFKKSRFIHFTGATKCNLCSCKQYVGKIGLGYKCICGHDYGDHEWV